RLQPPADGLLELVWVVGDRATRATQRERRPDDRRVADLTDERARLVEAPRVARARQREADALHRLLEELAVLRLPDRGELGADQLDDEALERAVLRQRDRRVQAPQARAGRAAAHGADALAVTDTASVRRYTTSSRRPWPIQTTSPFPQSFSPRTLMRRSTRSRIAWASRDVSLVVVNDVHSGFWPVPSVFRYEIRYLGM